MSAGVSAAPPEAVVVGGGVAGLAAAFGLADRGYRATLLESRQRCGGRAFSTPDRVFDRALDNGFHVMLGCYRSMRALCRRLGTEDGFRQDPRLSLRYRFEGGRSTALSLSGLPVPLAMPGGVLRLDLALGARLRALLGMGASLVGAPARWTFADWMRRLGQTGAPDDVLWRPLCRAVMNCEPEEASARAFLATLREAFLGAAGRAALWVPARPWGELLGAPAPRALDAAGVALRVGARVEGFDYQGDRIAAIALAGGERVALAPDAVVVSAMPWHALHKVLGERAPPQLGRLRAAPIVTAYFETSERRPPPDEGPVVALVGGAPFHFLLRTPGEGLGRFAVLSGGDRSFDGLHVDEIGRIARAQVARYYPDADLDGAVVRIRKEQRATFVPDREADGLRPRPGRLPQGPANLLVCGDWTATGLPATLEGAARSSEQALATLS